MVEKSCFSFGYALFLEVSVEILLFFLQRQAKHLEPDTSLLIMDSFLHPRFVEIFKLADVRLSWVAKPTSMSFVVLQKMGGAPRMSTRATLQVLY